MNNPLWTADEAALATDGILLGADDWQASGVSIDSRSVQTGDLFIALKGPSFDGHSYVKAALEKGAVAALVQHIPDGLPKDAPLLQVSNTEAGLRALGKAARARFAGKLVGITGSVGKTTARSMLATTLAAFGKVHATTGNLNNHYGVPLTLARMPKDTAYAVIEMGMNHAGEIRALTTQARPHVALITTVDAVHLEFFDSVEGIARAKAEIAEGLEPGGVAVLPADNRYYAVLQALSQRYAAQQLSFGATDSAQMRMTDYQQHGWGGAVQLCSEEHAAIHYTLPQPGAHVAANSVAVLACIQALGLDVARAANALGQWQPVDGRGVPIHVPLPDGGSFTLLDDSYNASPASISAALALFANITPAAGGRKLALLGDMLELGKDAPALHAGLAGAVEASGITALYTLGQKMQHLMQAIPTVQQGESFASIEDAVAGLRTALRPNDWLLVKGSHGSQSYRVVEGLQKNA